MANTVQKLRQKLNNNILGGMMALSSVFMTVGGSTHAYAAAENDNDFVKTEQTITNDDLAKDVARKLKSHAFDLQGLETVSLGDLGFTAEEQKAIIAEIIADEDGFVDAIRSHARGLNVDLIYKAIVEPSKSIAEIVRDGRDPFVFTFMDELGGDATVWTVFHDMNSHYYSEYGNTGRTPQALWSTHARSNSHIPNDSKLSDMPNIIAKVRAKFRANQNCAEVVELSAMIAFLKTFRDYTNGQKITFQGMPYHISGEAQENLAARGFFSMFDKLSADFRTSRYIDSYATSLSTNGVLNNALNLGDADFTKDAAVTSIAAIAEHFGTKIAYLVLRNANNSVNITRDINALDNSDCASEQAEIARLSGGKSILDLQRHMFDVHFKKDPGQESHLAEFTLQRIQQDVVPLFVEITRENAVTITKENISGLSVQYLTLTSGHHSAAYANVDNLISDETFNRAPVELRLYNVASLGYEIKTVESARRIMKGKEPGIFRGKVFANFNVMKADINVTSGSVLPELNGGEPNNIDGSDEPDNPFDDFVNNQGDTVDVSIDDIATRFDLPSTEHYAFGLTGGAEGHIHALYGGFAFDFKLIGLGGSNRTVRNFYENGHQILHLYAGLKVADFHFTKNNTTFDYVLKAEFRQIRHEWARTDDINFNPANDVNDITSFDQQLPGTYVFGETNNSIERGELEPDFAPVNQFLIKQDLRFNRWSIGATIGWQDPNTRDVEYLGVQGDANNPQTNPNLIPTTRRVDTSWEFFGNVTVGFRIGGDIQRIQRQRLQREVVNVNGNGVRDLYSYTDEAGHKKFTPRYQDNSLLDLFGITSNRKLNSGYWQVSEDDLQLRNEVAPTGYSDETQINQIQRLYQDAFNKSLDIAPVDTTSTTVTPLPAKGNANTAPNRNIVLPKTYGTPVSETDTLTDRYNVTAPIVIPVDTVQTLPQQQQHLTPTQQRIIDNAINSSKRSVDTQADSTSVLRNVFTPMNGSQAPANGNGGNGPVQKVKVAPVAKPKKTPAQILKELNIDN
ncbi:MAG: hypothetical protein AAF182_00185 [Pseudomonadota bacterium]